ncbi:MAG: hypothetical protein MR283_05140 [Erysipelotrichaceae bacterium]|nr:hypothetical protein [Erysipelotrichaceae bacterium]MDY6035669.1 hypothetical protein [Bulleidia sp.]
MNIYPYNMYLLYIACLITVICMIYFAIKVSSLKKQLEKTKTSVTPIQQRLQYITIANQVMQEERQRKKENQNKLLKFLFPIITSIILTYRSDDSLHGIKGYVGAGQRVFKQQRELSILKRQLSK